MKRHKPTLRQKLDTALLQLGLDPARVRLDHTPPLALRERTPDGGYIPAENDPRYMQFLSIEAHAVKTTGRRGTSGTVADGDVHKIYKAARLAKKHVAVAMDNALAQITAAKSKFPPGRPIQSRPFQKRKK